MIRFIARLLPSAFSLLLLGTSAGAEEPHAHVHGLATLAVAIDGNRLSLDFDGPMDNVLGFEHAPHDAAQRATLARVTTQLNQPAQLFAPNTAAGCAPTAIKLSSPLLPGGATDTHGDGHADLSAEYEFTCKDPQKLREIDVVMFGLFPHLQRIDASVVGPGGQSASRLTPTQRRISL